MDKNVHILELTKYEKPEVIETGQKEYVEFGEDNLYYDWVIERYKNSTTNNACINNIAKLIYGRGLQAKDAAKKPNDYAMLRTMVSPKTLRGIALNFKMLGAAYFQVLYNKQHTKIVKVDYIPTRLIRVGKCNEDGDIDTYFYSDDWEDVRKNEPRPIPAYGTSKEEIEIDCVKFDSIDMKYYTLPDYSGGLPYAVLEESIAEYQINDVNNHFSGTSLISFTNGVPSPEAQRDISRQIKEQVSGATGDKTIVSFSDNPESKAQIEKIALDNAPSHYQYLSEESQAKILNSHTIVSPMLVGITTSGNSFSSNADEIETATRVFYNSAIVSFQDAIIDRLDEYLAFNGASLDLFFRRLNLMESVEENKQAIEETNLSSVCCSKPTMDDIVSQYGEDESDEWELVDERPYSADDEDFLNEKLKEVEKDIKKKGKTKLSKLLNLVGTGRQSPNKPSELDEEIDGVFFKVRYVYAGNDRPQRPFCKAMMRASKLYRLEDLEAMGNSVVNAGFGPEGSDTYNIIKYKGGPNCKHLFFRRTYVSLKEKAAIGSMQTSEITTAMARKIGYKPEQDKLTAVMPFEQKDRGYLNPPWKK